MNGKEIIKILQLVNWQVVRVRGSHHLLSNGIKTVSVPVHGKKDIGAGLLRAIEKQTGVKLK
jgi:predicted RNA binding protein YcfA (HicA-like mRNA interferase family)